MVDGDQREGLGDREDARLLGGEARGLSLNLRVDKLADPGKLTDQVSDAVVDACFAGDAESHVACETCTGTNFAMIFGEITTNPKFDYESAVRATRPKS